MIEYLEIGKVANTHGVKGEIKVMPLTDDVQRFERLKWVYLEKGDRLLKYTIQGVKYSKGMVILKLAEINDMAAAEEIKGLFLKVDRDNAVKLEEGSFFICDILDSRVFDEQGKLLGNLKEVLRTGSNDVYVVKDENNREILIPALKSVVREVSLENKRLTVSLPEGLVDDEV